MTEQTERLVDIDLRLPSEVTALILERFLEGTPMTGLGQAFIDAEVTHGVNARYLCAHAILESNWGRSKIATLKKNLFGFGAYDASPLKSARTFASFQESIDHVAGYVRREYLSPGGRWFVSPTLRGMNRYYATDKQWADKIARIMSQIRTVRDFLPHPE